MSAPATSFLRRALTLRTTMALRYAAPAKGKGKKGGAAAASGPAEVAKFDPHVCTGANYFTTGTDPVIKPDEEYPAWLWTLLDKKDATDPMEKTYWQRKKKDDTKRKNQLSAKR